MGSWFSSKPPDWALWISVFAAGFAVIRYGYSFLMDLTSQMSAKRRDLLRREDEFWYQKILLPSTIAEVDDFFSGLILDLNSIQDAITASIDPDVIRAQFASFNSIFQSKKSKFLSKIGKVDLIPMGGETSLYTELAKLVDDLEDKLVDEIHPHAVKGIVTVVDAIDLDVICRGFHVDILRKLKNAHHNRFSGTNRLAESILFTKFILSAWFIVFGGLKLFHEPFRAAMVEEYGIPIWLVLLFGVLELGIPVMLWISRFQIVAASASIVVCVFYLIAGIATGSIVVAIGAAVAAAGASRLVYQLVESRRRNI